MNRRYVDDEREYESLGKKKRRLLLVDEDEYYFDLLPDDIVLSIIDRLSWSDAFKTCRLSRRFQHLSNTSISHRKNLDFEDSSMAPNMKFIEHVNQIMQRHEGSKVDSLRIAFNAPQTCTMEMYEDYKVLCDGVRKWLKFAREKSVQSLDLDLSLSGLNESTLFDPHFPVLGKWDTLTSLSLSWFHVTDADLEHWLKNHLVNLESLIIKHAESPKTVKIVSEKLKKLEIRSCYNINSIVIDLAPNLESFLYDGNTFDSGLSIKFNVVPRLSHVSLGGRALSHGSMSELTKIQTLEKVELLDPWLFEACFNFSPHFRVWDRLTSLTMKSVNVEDSDIEHLVTNLESLYIENASSLRVVSIRSMNLKRLEIKWCRRINRIEIDCAPNLEVLGYKGNDTYFGRRVMRVRDAPKLSHISIADKVDQGWMKKRNVAEKVYCPKAEVVEICFASRFVSMS